VLCRELLASDISTDLPVAAFMYLYAAIHTDIHRGLHVQSVDEAIECLQDAVKVIRKLAKKSFGFFRVFPCF